MQLTDCFTLGHWPYKSSSVSRPENFPDFGTIWQIFPWPEVKRNRFLFLLIQPAKTVVTGKSATSITGSPRSQMISSTSHFHFSLPTQRLFVCIIHDSPVFSLRGYRGFRISAKESLNRVCHLGRIWLFSGWVGAYRAGAKALENNNAE